MVVAVALMTFVVGSQARDPVATLAEAATAAAAAVVVAFWAISLMLMSSW